MLTGDRALDSMPVDVRGGAFSLELPAKGEISQGQYVVLVRFALEAQSQAVREALGYNPPSLGARRPLSIPVQLVATATAKTDLREIFDALVRMPREAAVLDDLDRRARALEERLWLSQQRAAIAKLRLAIEEARRPQVRQTDFERLILEAHVLGGL